MAALDKDSDGKVSASEVECLFEGVLKWKPKWAVDDHVTMWQLRRIIELRHRQHPELNVAGKVMEWAIQENKKNVGPTALLRPTAGKKKALLVGINYIGSANELGGCINDVRNEMDIITTHFGFPKEQVLLLTEDQNDASKMPTCENIRKGLSWLLSDAVEGDKLFFAYSGHGSQFPSRTESDGQNECICPLDCMEAPWPKNIILDDELNDDFFKRLPASVECVCIFDCCHSATVVDLACTKGLSAPNMTNSSAPESKPRYLTPPTVTREELEKIWATNRGQDAKARSLPTGALSDKQLWVISGCQDNQTSADATINGKRQGALTWALAKALEDHDYSVSYEDLIQAVRTNLCNYSQVPALSAPNESLFSRTYIDGPVDVTKSVAVKKPGSDAAINPAYLQFALVALGIAVGMCITNVLF
eukprot:CAMPEP_0117559332 /NCGR_PEP_ID=MMETSP0784-20121206/53305_1 /TAXON_ID=39447 /ORGANISM="" /LENGTH=419 /DNA_ID=CAMNT_0005356705 /DNA_START=202 /DNA_END=1461 /DNA_ORIENTATION=+